MRKSKFTESQIMAILKQNEAGVPIPELCREHGISSASFYKWRSKYGGMDTSLMKRMKELEEENRRLKKCMRKSALKLRFDWKLLRESSKAIPAQGDGERGDNQTCHQHSPRLPLSRY